MRTTSTSTKINVQSWVSLLMLELSLPQEIHCKLLLWFIYLLMLIMTASSWQLTLDGVVKTQPHISPFLTWGLINHLIELIISEDDVFQLLDRPAFWQLIHYLHPTLAIKDIPYQTKICEEVLAHAVQAKSQLKAMLQVCYPFVCLMKCLLTMLQGCQGGDLIHLRHLDFWGHQEQWLLIDYHPLYQLHCWQARSVDAEQRPTHFHATEGAPHWSKHRINHCKCPEWVWDFWKGRFYIHSMYRCWYANGL